MKKMTSMLLAAAMISSLTACGQSSSSTATTAAETTAAETTVAETAAETANQAVEVKGISAEAHITPVYHQISAIFVEYSADMAAPAADSFSVIDYAVSKAKEDYDRREYSEAVISAVYTNDSAAVRADKTSVPGKYVVIEIEPTSYCVEEDGIYKPNHNAGMCTWRLEGEKCEWLRDDFSELVVTQKVDLAGLDGGTAAAGTLPAIAADDIVTPELARFENKVIENFDGKNNSIYYTIYVPEDYSADRKYPLVFNSTGNGGRLNYDQKDADGNFVNIGAVVSRDAVAYAVSEYKEDSIVVSIQTWRNQPEEWEYNDTEAALYLLDEMKKEYSIDEDRIYAIGSSYGTMLVSSMLNTDPTLFDGYIQCNGAWRSEPSTVSGTFLSNYMDDENVNTLFAGETFESAYAFMKENRRDDNSLVKEVLKPIADAEIPIWCWHAVNDESISLMIGVTPYETLMELYAEKGLSTLEANNLIKLTVLEDDAYFSRGIAERHQTSKLVAVYPVMLDWLFAQ